MKLTGIILFAILSTAIFGLFRSRTPTASVNQVSTLALRYSGAIEFESNSKLERDLGNLSQANTVTRALAKAISEVPPPKPVAKISSSNPLSPARTHPSNNAAPIRTVSISNSISGSTSEKLRAVRYVLDSVTRGKRDSAKLSRQIVTECEKAQFDPMFVAAVIKSESFFNELARSNKGAVGLMQIMPATGKYLEKFRSEADWPTPAKLTDAGYNIHLGVTYLKQLDEMYGGNRVLTLIAYNWGPGKLDRAIRSGHGIPAETVRYALKILSDRHGWLQQKATT